MAGDVAPFIPSGKSLPEAKTLPQPAYINSYKLGSVRIMQKNIVYVIGLSP